MFHDPQVRAGFLAGLNGPSEAEKLAFDHFVSDLLEEWVGEETLKHASYEDLETIKAAFVGALARRGLTASNKLVTGARAGIRRQTGKVAPQLNMPVGTAVRDAANTMTKSKSQFVQGVGDTLKHKMHSKGTATLAALNPVGTVGEAVTAGAGRAASSRLSSAGKKLVQRHGGDDITRIGQSMTPAGRMKNRLAAAGQKLHTGFSAGGKGHKALTKTLPRTMEVAAPVALGSLAHMPAGAAAIAGKGTTAALGAMGVNAKLQGAVSGLASALPAGFGGVAQHAAEDIIGGAKLEKARALLARRAAG